MPDLPLDIGEDLPTISLIPAPIQVLSRQAKLNDEITRKVFRLYVASLLSPEAEEGSSSSPMMIRASEPPMK